MTPSPFIAPARAQTMLRDFEAHRKAVLSGDVANIDATWDRCERWVDQLRPDFTEQAEAAQQRIKTLERDNAILRARSTGAVYVCPECDIAGCRHERAAMRGEDQ